jgi:16S rRNA A1518/A1519 N6-dimethyltransferase RsmA/KsgA/DIM1 with predicted DNA glycosylase/AP lyase activity
MVDLMSKRACAPSFNPAQYRVEIAFQRIIEIDDLLEVRPAQFSPQCGDNLFVGELISDN